MKYHIEHVTDYDYGQEVSASHHVARLQPFSDGIQALGEFNMEVSPAPVEITFANDYFGNVVHRFALQELHDKLSVKTTSVVEVREDSGGMNSLVSAPWENVRDQVKAASSPENLAACEFIFPSPFIPVGREFSAYAGPFFPRGKPLLEAVLALTSRIHEEFSFDPAATTVSTPVATVLKQKRGVCQDFAHFQIACLRSLGIPARYVSGYVRTEPPPGQPRLIGADAMHAWVSVFCPGLGWTEFDPTNDCIPGDSHVRIAFGRDYSDISPIRGTVVGGGAQRLRIGVTMTPLGG